MSVQTAAVLPPSPPFRLMWAIAFDRWIKDLAISGDLIVALSSDEIAVVDKNSGEIQWRQPIPSFNPPGHVTVDSKWVVVVSPQEGRGLSSSKNWLRVFDLPTGRCLMTTTVHTTIRPHLRGGILYTPWKRERYAAIDVGKRKVRWTTRVPLKQKLEDVMLLGDHLLLRSDAEEYVVISAATGETRWHAGQDRCRLASADEELIVLSTSAGLTAHETATGNVRWQVPSKDFQRSEHLVGHFAIGRNDLRFLRLNTKTGRVDEIFDLNEDGQDRSTVSTTFEGWSVMGESLLLQHNSHAKCIGFGGEVLWITNELPGLELVWTDGELLLTKRHTRLFGYRTGDSEPLPIEPLARREHAESLCGRARLLPPTSWSDLEKLAPESVKPLLDLYAASGGCASESIAPYEILGLLERVLSASDIPHLIDAYERCRESGYQLLRLLAGVRDPVVGSPYLLQGLKQGRFNQWEEIIAFQGLAEADYSPGHEYVIRRFEEGSESTRMALYDILPRIGEAGAALVIGYRESHRYRPDLWPGVTRYAATDLEKAMEAAFDSQASGDWWLEEEGAQHGIRVGVNFPEGVEPFIMPGPKVMCLANAPESQQVFSTLYVCREGDFPDSPRVGEDVAMSYTQYSGPLAAAGYEVIVRKFEAGWAPVGRRLLWRA